MDQHARRAFRAAQHLADFARVELVDEAQHKGAATVGRQQVNGRECCTQLSALCGSILDVVRGRQLKGRVERCLRWRLLRRRSFDSALRATWNSHTRKLDRGGSACSWK